MLAFPRSNAVLVRGHGVYIWGRDWVSHQEPGRVLRLPVCRQRPACASTGIDASVLGRSHPRTP